jgi:hypothetical protein
MAERMGFKAGQPCSKYQDLMYIRKETIQNSLRLRWDLLTRQKWEEVKFKR